MNRLIVTITLAISSLLLSSCGCKKPFKAPPLRPLPVFKEINPSPVESIEPDSKATIHSAKGVIVTPQKAFNSPETEIDGPENVIDVFLD